jgi:hypothetical protein
MNTLRTLWRDDGGFILSAELVLILTIGCIGMIVGLNSVATSVTNELNDISSAIGTIDQSYYYNGLTKAGHAAVVGSGFADGADFCDCSIVTQTQAAIHGNSSAYSEAAGYSGSSSYAEAYSYSGAYAGAAAGAGAGAGGAYAFGAFGVGAGGAFTIGAGALGVGAGGGIAGAFTFAADGTLVIVLADGSIINVSTTGVIVRVSVAGAVVDAAGNAFAGTVYGIAQDGSVFVLTIVEGKATNLLAAGATIVVVVNPYQLIGGYVIANNGTFVRTLSSGVILNIRVDGTIVLVATDGRVTNEAGVVIQNVGIIYSLSSTGVVSVLSLKGMDNSSKAATEAGVISNNPSLPSTPAVDTVPEPGSGNGKTDCMDEKGKKVDCVEEKSGTDKTKLKPVPDPNYIHK